MNHDNPFSTVTGPGDHPDVNRRPDIPGFDIVGDKPLGEGGMGVVWEAAQQQPKRRVAIKTLKHWSARLIDINRALAEAELLASLQHQHIVALYEFGWFDQGGVRRPYFVMPLIHGELLDVFVRTRQPSLKTRTSLFLEILDAVASAHDNNIVHRDLKPRNVMVGAKGKATVLDFGIADFLNGDGSSNEIRGTTLPYASPEQAEEFWEYQGRFSTGPIEREGRASSGDAIVHSTAERISRVGAASDVYSLGVLAFQLFDPEFRRPYREGESTWQSREASLEALKRRPLLAPALAGRRLGHVILKALEVEPKRRYANAAALKEDVQRAISGRVTSAGPNNPLEHAVSYVAVHRVPLTIALLLALGIVGTSMQTARATRARAAAVGLAARNGELAEKERLARVRVETLAQSTDRAMDFLDQVIFSVDTYNSRNQTINWDYVFRAAREKLAAVQGDARAEAIVLRAMGRVASNWGRHAEGADWLARSAERWRQVAGNDGAAGSAPGVNVRAEEAKTRNWLAWALAGSGRRPEAAKAAEDAYRLSRDAEGPLHDDTFAYRFDWAKMRLDGGDLVGGAGEFLDAMAEASGTASADYLRRLAKECHEIAGLSKSDNRAANVHMLRLIAPLLDPARPRLRGRVPWSLVQGGDFMTTKTFALQLFLSAAFTRYGIPIAELPANDDVRAAGRVAIDVASGLADSVLAPGHPDIAKTHDVRDRVIGKTGE